jgi:hypothetical protein
MLFVKVTQDLKSDKEEQKWKENNKYLSNSN